MTNVCEICFCPYGRLMEVTAVMECGGVVAFHYEICDECCPPNKKPNRAVMNWMTESFRRRLHA
jgi:hypothetical protein